MNEPVRFSKLASAWNNIHGNKTESRQERILKEQEERSQTIKDGKNPNTTDNNYKPGQDEPMNEQFSARRAKQFLAEKLNQTKTQKVFKGSSDQCMLKLASLFGNLDEGTSKLEKGKILNVEDCGFGQYKITYVPT